MRPLVSDINEVHPIVANALLLHRAYKSRATLKVELWLRDVRGLDEIAQARPSHMGLRIQSLSSDTALLVMLTGLFRFKPRPSNRGHK